MKDLAVILSHADTEDKIALLEDSIDNLILQNKKILVSTHIDIPKYLYDKVDYVFYDKENPLIRYDEYQSQFNIVYVWASFAGYYQSFPIEFNHAFAVHKLILNACAIAQLHEFDVIHFINYDYVIKDPQVLAFHNFMLNSHDIITYDWYGQGATHRENISSSFFSVKTDVFYKTILTSRTKEEYCSNGNPIYEEFLFSICKELKLHYIPITDLRKNNNIIAAKSVIDDYVISFEDDGSSLLVYISKENDQYYLFVSFPKQTKVLVNDREFETSLVTLIAVSEEQLETGLDIEFPELNIKRHFNKKTSVALAQVQDKNLINYSFIKQKKTYSIEEYCDDSKTKRWDVINFLAEKFGSLNYLEIGVNDGSCIRQINIPHKDGVDPFPGAEIGGCVVPEINYQMTSDEFFNSYVNRKYDIIFIDGLHHSEQVDKDIQNSLNYLEEGGFIILHDCNPPTYDVQVVPRQTGIWNGDVWKSVVRLRCQRPDLEVSVIDTDWGLGVVTRGQQNLLPYNIEQCLDWNFFDNNREEILNMVSVEDFFNKYKKKNLMML
jgi:hypothetical protein